MKKLISAIMIALLCFMTQLSAHAEEAQPLDLKSEAAALLDTDTGAVLYAKNANEKMYPASLTKIATAIYALENGNLDSLVTVSANAANQDGTRVYLTEGEQVPLKKLIQGMIINSGNDAAVAIAEHIDGSVEQFAENLNSYLKTKIGVTNTHFTNPNGLFDENHYTTAMDLALITNYAMKNPLFVEIFGAKTLEWKVQSWETTLLTHHQMLKGERPYPGITGGKTGYVTESKQTLATTADNGKLRLTAIEMKANTKKEIYKDTGLLFDYGFNTFQHETLKQGEIFNVGQKEFYPSADTLVTEKLNSSNRMVNTAGLLSIKDSNGQVIQSVQLAYKEPPKSKVNKQTNKEQETKHPVQSNAIFGVSLIVGAVIIVGIRRRIAKNMNDR